jgi:hypothetical protein
MTIKHSITSAIAAIVLTLGAATARAQQYRVELAVPDGKVAIAQFHPCVGAATADCGAWVERTIESNGSGLALVARAVSANKHDSVSVEDGRVRIKALDGRKPPIMFLKIGTGVPRGIIISRDSRYAFVVLENDTGNPTDVMMIDLATQNGIAGLVLDTRVLGIGMGR